MTEPHLPILADGLFDGGLAADVAPKDLRAAVDVLRVAQQPGSVTELALMADRVRQFSAEVNSSAVAVGLRSTAQAATTSFLTHDNTRSTPMFATRITRKAFTVVAITLLAAGTAAAAANGSLPMFVDDEPAVSVDNGDAGAVDVNDQSENEASADDETATPPTSEDIVENNNGDVDHHGKCTAWTNGAPKDPTNPAFAELQVAADAAGVTIDEYCAAFLANNDDSDDSDDASDDTETTKGNSGNGNSGNSGNSGNGNSGNGNSGNSGNNGNSGNGNSGNSNSGNSGDNGNSGNGNSGNGNSGNGNSGNGNSGNGHDKKSDD